MSTPRADVGRTRLDDYPLLENTGTERSCNEPDQPCDKAVACPSVRECPLSLHTPHSHPGRRSGMSPRALLEVDAHHGPAEARTADLREPGHGEDAYVADVELALGNVLPGLGDHRVTLERAGTALAREVHRGARKRVADAAATEP